MLYPTPWGKQTLHLQQLLPPFGGIEGGYQYESYY